MFETSPGYDDWKLSGPKEPLPCSACGEDRDTEDPEETQCSSCIKDEEPLEEEED